MRFSRSSAVHRNLAWLLLLQVVLVIYVFYPYYISPYVFNEADASTAQNYTLALPHAVFKQRNVPWLSARVLPRVMNPDEHRACAKLMKTMHRFFIDNNITYALFYGSLVGSYVMHDIIPWDDDIDLVVPLSQKTRLERALETEAEKYGMQAIHHDALRAETYKVFFKDSKAAGNRPWNWPFIDLAFYGENDTHVWNTNAEGVLPLLIPRDWFYPLRPRPFASLWIPTPRETSSLLRRLYGHFKCKRFAWNHKDETPWWSIAYAPCPSLQKFYPFVWRSPAPEPNTVIETLRLGDLELYSVRMNDSKFAGIYEPFEF
jgi:hypothetical protein